MENNKIKTWSLVNYFDVWGNAKEGYEVNNLYREFDDLHISDDITDGELIKYLKDIGFFGKSAGLNTIIVENIGDMIEFSRKRDYKPLCRLELNY